MSITTLVGVDAQTPVGVAANPLAMSQQPLPTGAVRVVATSGSVANAIAAASLAAAAGKTTYITGFEVYGSGATAGSVVDVTVAGLIGGVTFHYSLAVQANALAQNQPIQVQFPLPIPASAVNSAITVSCPALGAGNTANAVNAHGFQV